MVSFTDRHAAAISYRVTLLNASAPIVISSEMAANAPSAYSGMEDPRQTKAFVGPMLHHRAGFANGHRIALSHGTEKSRLVLTCAIDHALEASCAHTYKTSHAEDIGQVVFTIEARAGSPIQLTKYMVYHTSRTATVEGLSDRAGWTLDRLKSPGFEALLASQEQYLDDFWRRSDVQIRDVRADRTKRTTVEIQQAIRFNLFHILQASARAEDTGVPAKGLTRQAYEGHYFWTPKSTCFHF